MTDYENTKAVVTVAEMARMVGLSRARFYQLMGSTFPEPSRDEKTNRPFYTEEQQKVCLEVRRRNCGINGKPILFYARRGGEQSLRKRAANNKPKPNAEQVAIVEAVRSLGLASATPSQVGKAIREMFPEGIQCVEEGEVVRAVFLFIKRQEPER